MRGESPDFCSEMKLFIFLRGPAELVRGLRACRAGMGEIPEGMLLIDGVR